MLRISVLVALVALCGAVPFNADLDEQWTAWRGRYAKVYSGEEEVLRRLVWEQNLGTVTRHNLDFSMGKHTYTLGMNEFADLTNSEFRTQFNGYKRSVTRTGQGSTFLPPGNMPRLPDTVDWRTKGYVTGVKNQLQCGSCWAFSATGSLEGQHFKQTGKLVSLSEQNLMDCSRPEGNMACEGGLMDQAFEYIKKNGGVDTEACYPYKARDEACHFDKSCIGAMLTGYTDIASRNETALQQAVATVGPVSVAIDASHMSFQLYRSGVYNEPECSQTQLDHGVLAVGYGTLNGETYWLVKNSWGESWGMKGYIMMSRNKNNQCGIATASSYPLV